MVNLKAAMYEQQTGGLALFSALCARVAYVNVVVQAREVGLEVRPKQRYSLS